MLHSEVYFGYELGQYVKVVVMSTSFVGGNDGEGLGWRMSHPHIHLVPHLKYI